MTAAAPPSERDDLDPPADRLGLIVGSAAHFEPDPPLSALIQPARPGNGHDSTEQRLHQSEARYQALVEASAAAVWTTDAEGRADADSPSWRRYTGQSLDEWFGSRWVDAVHPEDRDEAAREWTKAVAAGQPAACEFRLRHAASGGWRLTRLRALPLRDASGRVTSWIGMNVEIDDLRRAEAAQAERESVQGFLLALGDRLRGTAIASEVKTIAVEMIGRRVGVARAGYAEVDARGEVVRVEGEWSHGVPSLIGEARLLDGFGPALAGELREGRTVRVEDCATDPRTTGEQAAETWASIQMRAVIAVPLVKERRLVSLLYLQEPHPRAWTEAEERLAGEVAERTWEAVERARAEAALRASEERLHAVADAMPALISYIDAGQRFRFVNRLYAEWFGRPLEEFSGRHLREIMGEEMYEARRPYVERALTGEQVSYEIVFPGEPGRVTVVQHVPHFAEDGQVVGLYSLVQDVSGQKQVEAALRESRDEFAAVLDTVPAAIFLTTDPDCQRIRTNREGAAMLRMEHGENMSKSDLSAPTGHFKVFDSTGRELSTEQLPLQRAVRGESSSMHEERIVFEDGTSLDLLGNAVPIRDSDGVIRGAVGAFIDIGERRRAEEALREETRLLETLNRTGAALAAELDLERLVQLVTDAGVAVTGAKFGAFFHHLLNDAGESMLLYTLSGAQRSDFEKLGLPRATRVFQPTFRGEAIVRSDDIMADTRYGEYAPYHGMPPGHLPVRSYLAVPVVSRDGEAIGSLLFGHPEPRRFTERHERLLVGIAAQAAIALDNARLFREAQREIEQRKRAENHQRLLIDELNHRVKNSLAIVQSVAQQTFREGAGVDEARRAFEGRLSALSSAHGTLTRRNWEHARFGEIVEGALAPFHRPGDGRLALKGEDMQLQPKTAVSLAMAFHELATNAVKYGAWANESGRVLVEWQINSSQQDPRLQLAWREEGGPPVTAPSRRGFGSRMIERALAAELDGSVRLLFDAAGLRCEINAPLPPPPSPAEPPLAESAA